MISSDLLAHAYNYVRERLQDELSEAAQYHNWEHTKYVYEEARRLGEQSDLAQADLHALLMAALFHDIGFIQGKKDHEARSMAEADRYLTEQGVDKTSIQLVQSIINSTCIDKEASDTLQQIMCDADLSNLGSDHFHENTEKLRKELELTTGKPISDLEWVETNLAFLRKHSYNSAVAQMNYRDKKEKNLKELEVKKDKLLAIESKRNKKQKIKKKKKKSTAILSDRRAQLMYKTTMRNQIDLTAIADNKANIMLSVNAIIISVGIPILIDAISGLKGLIVPTILLLITCLGSMFFATLVTRPIKMKGTMTWTADQKKGLNPFFFGNFFKMDYDQYYQGLEYVFSDEEITDDAAFRDLFFLGRSLGYKYSQLRICYTIFISGIALSVLAFLIIVLVDFQTL